jgi:hypothetical protein
VQCFPIKMIRYGESSKQNDPPLSATSSTTPRGTNSLWYVSIDWPLPETIRVGLFMTDTIEVIMQKVRNRVRHKVAQANAEQKKAGGKFVEDKFNYIAADDVAHRFHLYYSDDTGFHRMDYRHQLNHYSEKFKDTTSNILYMKILSIQARADQIWPETEELSQVASNRRLRDDCRENNSRSTNNSSTKRRRVISDTGSTKGDDDSDDDSDDLESITEVNNNGGYLSRAQCICPYSSMRYINAMHNRSSSAGCQHRLDRDSLTQLLAIRWRDNKLKTVDCPVHGCSGKWTEKRSRVDDEYQDKVNTSSAYHDQPQEGNYGSGSCIGGSKKFEIIELDL